MQTSKLSKNHPCRRGGPYVFMLPLAPPRLGKMHDELGRMIDRDILQRGSDAVGDVGADTSRTAP